MFARRCENENILHRKLLVCREHCAHKEPLEPDLGNRIKWLSRKMLAPFLPPHLFQQVTKCRPSARWTKEREEGI